ncbi:MAG: hypothetical protein IT578_00635 [Verrucomicrobiae bacterium]|nr:hypothetical protein [Verrucomicrobiae bacterium]
MRRLILLAGLGFGLGTAGAPFGARGAELLLENERLAVTLDSKGGRIASLVVKSDGVDLAASASPGPWQGLAKERIAASGQNALLAAEFALARVGDRAVLATATLAEGPLKGSRIEKTFTLDDREAVVHVRVTIVVGQGSGATVSIHNFLPGLSVTDVREYAFADAAGVRRQRPVGDAGFDVKEARWFAVDSPRMGLLAAFETSLPIRISSYLDASCATLEWSYPPLAGQGKSVRYDYTLRPVGVDRSEAFGEWKRLMAAPLPAAPATNARTEGAGPQTRVKPLTTSLPKLPPKKSGYAFVGNLAQIAYVSPDTPAMLHFRAINPKHAPELVLALPPGLKPVAGFRNLTLRSEGLTQMEGTALETFRVTGADKGSAPPATILVTTDMTAMAHPHSTGWFWGEWNGGKQTPQKLVLEVIRVPRVVPFKKILVWLCLPSDLAAAWPDLAPLRESGLNALDLWTYLRRGERETWGERALDAGVERTRAAGLQPIAWIREWWWEAAKKTEEGKATLLNGSKTDMLCPSYRGPCFEELLEQGRYLLDRGLNFHSTDPEIYQAGEKICFCSRCTDAFAKFLAAKHPTLPAEKPEVFEKEPARFPQLHAAWNEFKCGLYAQIFADYRKAMEEHLSRRGVKTPFRFMVYSTYHRAWDSFDGYADHTRSPVYTRTLEDPAQLAGIFDVLSPMSYMDIYANYGPYDMLVPRKDVSSLLRLVGGKCAVAPLLSPGYPYLDAYDADTSPEMLKANILESLVAGAKGFGLWGACPIDAADLRAIAEVVGMLAPHETILLEGKPTDRVSVPAENVCVRRLESSSGSLVLVSEYSDRPITAEIRCPVERPSVVTDPATGQAVATIRPGSTSFSVSLRGERARLFVVKETPGK